MRRREFFSLLGSAAAAWLLPVRAQQPAMPMIGFLHVASQETYSHVIAGLRRGLAETDFVEGRNVAVEYRWGEGQLDRMPSLLADLLDHQVSVIVASLQGAQAAKSTGVTIPVLFSSSDDPVKQGFVENLNRPGGNMTGVYLFTAELEGKRLGLLHDVVPRPRSSRRLSMRTIPPPMPNCATCRARRPAWACNSSSCTPIQITISKLHLRG
jgi:putative tryptophan/tyrosine transport system substrate-binding protein